MLKYVVCLEIKRNWWSVGSALAEGGRRVAGFAGRDDVMTGRQTGKRESTVVRREHRLDVTDAAKRHTRVAERLAGIGGGDTAAERRRSRLSLNGEGASRRPRVAAPPHPPQEQEGPPPPHIGPCRFSLGVWPLSF